MKQYLHELENVRGKKLAILVTMSSDGNQIATTQIKTALEVQGMEWVGQLKIKGSDQESGSWQPKLEEFAQYFME